MKEVKEDEKSIDGECPNVNWVEACCVTPDICLSIVDQIESD